MKKTYKLSTILLLIVVTVSCKDKILPIDSIDELSGNWGGTSKYRGVGEKTDSLGVSMKFDGELLTVRFGFYKSSQDKFPSEIEFQYKKANDFFKKSDTLTLEPSNMSAWDGTNVAGGELYPESLSQYPTLKIVKQSPEHFKILYDLPKLNELVFEQSMGRIGYKDFESEKEFEIKKMKNEKDFWYFNPYRSLASFSQSEKGFISHDLDVADEYVLATRGNLNIYFDLPNENGVSDKNDFLNDFSKYGSVFKLDINSDKQDDIAGYFLNQGHLYFIVFLNNGITYNKFHSQRLLLEDALRPVFMKDKLNGKDVLRINYVNHYVTNYLYFDSLERNMKVHYTD